MTTDDYYGVHIKGREIEEAAAMVGGYGKRVERPAELKGALQEAAGLRSVGQDRRPQRDHARSRQSALRRSQRHRTCIIGCGS